MEDLDRAKALLEDGGHTCVLCRGGEVHTSDRRGVAPLLGWLDSGAVKSGFCAADKVVGRATAYLYCLLGAKAVYAGVMSNAALQVLEDHGIEATFSQQVDYIRNRTGDGMCPMEQATATVQTPGEALVAIRAKLRQLSREA